jgi:hypothetical protein
MPRFTASRKRVLIWALVKMFLTVCDRQHDAATAISLDQPLTLSVAHSTGRTNTSNESKIVLAHIPVNKRGEVERRS